MRAVGGGVVAPIGARAPGVGGATAPPLRGPFAGSLDASTCVLPLQAASPRRRKGQRARTTSITIITTAEFIASPGVFMCSPLTRVLTP